LPSHEIIRQALQFGFKIRFLDSRCNTWDGFLAAWRLDVFRWRCPSPYTIVLRLVSVVIQRRSFPTMLFQQRLRKISGKISSVTPSTMACSWRLQFANVARASCIASARPRFG